MHCLRDLTRQGVLVFSGNRVKVKKYTGAIKNQRKVGNAFQNKRLYWQHRQEPYLTT